MQIGQNTLDLTSPKVMAIVNLTPDSFFDGGTYSTTKAIHKRIDEVVQEGAEIIDLGAYSTRPGAVEIDIETEWERIVPALSYIRKNYAHIPVSIDTFRTEIADRVRRFFGAFVLNDISAGTLDENLFPWIKKHKLPYILMHIQGVPRSMQQSPHYDDVVQEVYDFLASKLRELQLAGVQDIILDLGFGFGKTIRHNYTLLKNQKKFEDLGYPILTGISRKSMIYNLLENKPTDALNGTTVLNTIALERGAKILRVHDVKEAKETIKLYLELEKS